MSASNSSSSSSSSSGGSGNNNKRKWTVYTSNEMRDKCATKTSPDKPPSGISKRRNSAPPGMIHFPPGTFGLTTPTKEITTTPTITPTIISASSPSRPRAQTLTVPSSSPHHHPFRSPSSPPSGSSPSPSSPQLPDLRLSDSESSPIINYHPYNNNNNNKSRSPSPTPPSPRTLLHPRPTLPRPKSPTSTPRHLSHSTSGSNGSSNGSSNGNGNGNVHAYPRKRRASLPNLVVIDGEERDYPLLPTIEHYFAKLQDMPLLPDFMQHNNNNSNNITSSSSSSSSCGEEEKKAKAAFAAEMKEYLCSTPAERQLLPSFQSLLQTISEERDDDSFSRKLTPIST